MTRNKCCKGGEKGGGGILKAHTILHLRQETAKLKSEHKIVLFAVMTSKVAPV